MASDAVIAFNDGARGREHDLVSERTMRGCQLGYALPRRTLLTTQSSWLCMTLLMILTP